MSEVLIDRWLPSLKLQTIASELAGLTDHVKQLHERSPADE